MAVRRGSGHFGYVFPEAGRPPWVFCNTSLAQFLACEHVAGAFQQQGQHLERLLLQPEPRSVLAQLAGPEVQFKDAEARESYAKFVKAWARADADLPEMKRATRVLGDCALRVQTS